MAEEQVCTERETSPADGGELLLPEAKRPRLQEDPEPEEQKEKKSGGSFSKRRKVILLLSYSGKGYMGMQRWVSCLQPGYLWLTCPTTGTLVCPPLRRICWRP